MTSPFGMGGRGPIPIVKVGISEDVKRAVKTACATAYGDKPYSSFVLAYKYGSLFMYSVGAYSQRELPALEISLDRIKSAFTVSLGETLSSTEIIFGGAWYGAPSSLKFMLIVHT